jgi:hypothetical protein
MRRNYGNLSFFGGGIMQWNTWILANFTDKKSLDTRYKTYQLQSVKKPFFITALTFSLIKNPPI